jgi:hypothetical protein
MSSIAVLASLVLAVVAGPSERSPYRHVRSTQERTERLFDIGSRRSPTFARLRATLERTNVIVYVQTSNHLPTDLEGSLIFLTEAQGMRYLRIDVRASLPANELISAIGHELQHAVEIAQAEEVRDPESMGRFYKRIGVSRLALSGFDTDEARAVRVRVRAELHGA